MTSLTYAGDVLVRRKCLRSEAENSWEKAQRCDPGKATGGAGPLARDTIWYPLHGWFVIEKIIKMDDLGVPLF